MTSYEKCSFFILSIYRHKPSYFQSQTTLFENWNLLKSYTSSSSIFPRESKMADEKKEVQDTPMKRNNQTEFYSLVQWTWMKTTIMEMICQQLIIVYAKFFVNFLHVNCEVKLEVVVDTCHCDCCCMLFWGKRNCFHVW